jgi:phage-related tail fiber protein
MNTSYLEFLLTHPPLFSGAKDPLKADDWLHAIESKFGLLHYTEYQKTLYAAQQLRGSAGAWWASYTATPLAKYHVSWASFAPLSVATTYQLAQCVTNLQSF